MQVPETGVRAFNWVGDGIGRESEGASAGAGAGWNVHTHIPGAE